MIWYAAQSDIGFTDNKEHVQEDFVHVRRYDTSEGEILFGVVADGAGSIGTQYQPARIAAIQIEETIKRICQKNAREFLACPQLFLQEAMISAGNMLGVFRELDEQHFNGFATSMSCVLLHNGKFYFAHTGHTRIYLVRINKNNLLEIVQLTADQTKGMELVNNGEISIEEYRFHPARLDIRGGLGLVTEPKIQVIRGANFAENQFLLLTTDGIHNALWPDIMLEILKNSTSVQDVVDTLIKAAKEQNYQDNMASLIIWNQPEAKSEA